MNITRTAPFVLLLALLATAAAAAPNADYEAALERVAKVAADLQSYELHGTMLMSTRPLGQTGGTQMSADIFAAARYPDRLVSRQSGAIFNMDLGVGADQSWFYLSRQNACFLGKPYRLSRDLEPDRDMELVPEKIYNFYSGLGQALLPEGLPVSPETGHETFRLDGRDVPCQVFRTPENREAGMGPREYWYDPESGLVLKTVLSVIGKRGGTLMEQSMTFETLALAVNEPVDESVFTYTPPASATVVDQLEKVVNPESMVGEQAPDVTFTGLDGKTVRLSDFKGKVVFLDIWATWCGPCKIEMPHLQKLHEELSPGGEVVFLAASSEAKATIKAFIEKAGYTFKVVMISQEDAAIRYKASNIPAGFVIDRDGVIRAHMVGAQTEPALRAALARAGIGD